MLRLHCKFVAKCFLLWLLFSLVANFTWAQSETATVSGQVVDPSGLNVTGAQVKLVDIDRDTSIGATTNNSGLYTFPSVRPGRYRMAVSAAGFRTVDVTGLVVNVQAHLEQNFKLAIGSVSQSVTVEADAVSVSGSVSTVIDRTLVGNLPLNGRSFNTLLQLTPGVVVAPTTGAGSGQFSVAGQRSDANNFIVDGVSANFGISPVLNVGSSGAGEAQAFSALGGTSSLVSVDALQEFRIETSSFAPEFGRSPGGQVILNTRSGTNQFHGGLYEYFRNDVMDANNWFNDASIPAIPKATERHNDFGGFIGGPVWKGNTFFFLSYEGARLRLPQSLGIQVPSEWARQVAAPPSLAPFLNAYPEPDDKTVTPGAYTAKLTGSFSDQATLDAASLRLDHTINQKYSIFGRYNFAPSKTQNRVNALAEIDTTTVNTQTLTIGVSMVLTDRISNYVHGNYSTQMSGLASKLSAFDGATPLDPSLLVGSLSPSSNQAFFYLFDTGFYQFGPDARNRTRQFQFTDDLSIVVGSHQLKFGGDYRALLIAETPYNNSLQFESSSVQDFLSSGTPSLLSSTQKSVRLVAQAFSLYAQDTWRQSPRLTLTYGLRWELNPAPSGRDGTTLASWTGVDQPGSIAMAPLGTPVWATTYGNIAPRFGIVYSFRRSGDLVLRAGGGVFYDLGVSGAASLGAAFPNSASGYFSAASVPISNIGQFLPAISLFPPYPNVVGYRPDLVLPRSYQWNAALEKSFKGLQSVSVTFLGAAGRSLLRQEALYQPNPNFSGGFLLTGNSAYSNYDALQVQYRRQLSRNLQALASYTYSHSLDNSSNDVVAGLSGTVISAASDYASSDFDVRHSFSGAFTYALPHFEKWRAVSALSRSWSVDGTVVVRSGFPFNATTNQSSPVNFFATTRPDLVAGQSVYLVGAQCASVFQSIGVLASGQVCPGRKGLNPMAFSIPSTPRQGTEGRNDLRGFGLTQIDFSLVRSFSLPERMTLQFRADAFNVVNHPSFANPLADLDFGPSYLLSIFTLNQALGGLNPLFQEGGPRSLQLSLRLTF